MGFLKGLAIALLSFLLFLCLSLFGIAFLVNQTILNPGFISSELDEVLRCSHRIMVLRDREKVAEFPGDIDEHTVMQSIGGGGQ